MTIGFRLEDYLPAGVEKQIFEPLYLPISRIDEAVPASLIEMTVGDVTREVWIQRSENPEGPWFKPVPFGDRLFEIAYDVNRRPWRSNSSSTSLSATSSRGPSSPPSSSARCGLTDPSGAIKASRTRSG